jgi:8-amino-7-oxononanoate synthase
MLIEHLNRQLREREAQALQRRRRVAHTACSPEQTVAREGEPGSAKPMLAFCSNDYLGLAQHPALIAALKEAADQWGVGSGASHLVSGHSLAHEQLEQQLAALYAPFIPGARAISFCTGYMANLALLTALGDKQATILSDKLNHASLIDGALLAAATVQRYPHNRVDRVDALLQAATTPVKLIVTDGVFSMDGDLAPLPELLALAEQHDAWLVIDEAHAFGVLGAHGEGCLGHFGLRSERLIVMGTLGKAAGMGGAFVAAHPAVIEALIQLSRPYIYTTAQPAAMAQALQASVTLIAGPEGAERRAHLQSLIARLRAGLTDLINQHPVLGWQLPDSPTAIQPLIVGSNDAALRLSAALETLGLWVPAIRPPTVPVGTARLRITLSAAHTEGQVDRLLAALADIAAQEPSP